METRFSPSSRLNAHVLDKYLSLPQPESKFLVEYVWIECSEELSSKTRTLLCDFDRESFHLTDVPAWGTPFQRDDRGTIAHDIDVFLKPVALYKDPFRRGNNKLVLCEMYDFENAPIASDRCSCLEAVNAAAAQEPWFGVVQEYLVIDMNGRGFGIRNENSSYCGVGVERVFGRDLVEAHYRACLYAGIDIAGTKAKDSGFWEFRLGPSRGIDIGDQLWMARFILARVAEDFGVEISFDAGGRRRTLFSFSMKEMRENGHFEEAAAKLSRIEYPRIDPYAMTQGLVPLFNTRPPPTNEGDKVTVEHSKAVAQKKGYLEDRRPLSNCDPYTVIKTIVRRVCLDEFE